MEKKLSITFFKTKSFETKHSNFCSVGTEWQEQRRFSLKSLKDLGFGRNKLDTIIHEEVNILIDDLLLRSGAGDVLIDDIFNFPIVNILWRIVASKRYDPDLPESKRMMKDVGIVFHEGISMINFSFTLQF